MNIPGFRMWWVEAAVGAALLATIGVQYGRIASLKVDVATQKKDASDLRADKERLVRGHSEAMRKAQGIHAAAQQEKDDVYTTKLAALQAERAADARAVVGLRRDLATYAARGGRAGETDAARAGRAEDRLAALAGLLDEGISLVAEGRSLVGQRDAEVMTLVEQVRIDREACSK